MKCHVTFFPDKELDVDEAEYRYFQTAGLLVNDAESTTEDSTSNEELDNNGVDQRADTGTDVPPAQ